MKIFKAETGCLVVWRAGRVVTDKLYTPENRMLNGKTILITGGTGSRSGRPGPQG